MAFGNPPQIFELQAVVNILTNKAEKQLQSVEKTAKKTGRAAEDSMNDATSAVDRLRLAGVALKGALVASLAAVGGAAVAMGAQLHDSMLQFQVDLGASAIEADRLNDTVTNLWKHNTEGLDELADVVKAVRQNMGDLGEQTEDVTQTFLDFIKVTGSRDPEAAIKAGASALKAYGAEAAQLEPLLNAAFVVQQKTGADAVKLLESLAQNAPAFQSLNLSVQESVSLLGLLEKSGAGVGTANESLRNVVRATTSTTDEQAKAFRTLGIELNSLGQPVGSARDVLDSLIQKAADGELVSDKLIAATKILGEEAGGKFVTAMRQGAGGLAQLSEEATNSTSALANASDLIDRKFSPQLQLLFKKTFGAAALELAQVLDDYGAPLLDWLNDVVDYLQNLSRSDVVAFFDGLKERFPEVTAVLGDLVDAFQGLYTVLRDAFVDLGLVISENWETLQEWGRIALDVVNQVGGVVIGGLAGMSEAFVRTFTFILKTLKDFASVAGGVTAGLGLAWSEVVEGMSGVWESFANTVLDLWQDVISGVLSGIQALPEAVRGPLGDVEKQLAETSDRLAKRQRPNKSFAESALQIVSAPAKVAEVTTAAVLGNDVAEQRAKNTAIPNPLAGLLQPTAPKESFVGPVAPGTPITASGGGQSGEGASGPQVTSEDIKARVKDLERQLALEKITQAAAVEKYKAILSAAKAANLGAQEVFEVEKALFDLQRSVTKNAEDQAKKRAAINDKMKVEYLKAVKGELFGLLEALDQEKKARMEAGADSVQLEAWYAAQRHRILKEDREKRDKLAKQKGDEAFGRAQDALKIEADILAANDKKLEASIKSLEAERDAAIHAGVEKLKAEERFQAEKSKLEKQYGQERLKAQEVLQQEILKNEAAVSKDSEKAQEALLKASNIAKLAAYRDQVKAAREAGVEEVVIQRYINSEQKKLLEQAKADRDAAARSVSGSSADPRKNFEQAFEGLQSGLNFSIGGERKGRMIDPAAAKASKQLASDLGKLGAPSAGAGTAVTKEINESARAKEQQPLQDTLNIRVVSPTGDLVFDEVVSRGTGEEREFTTDYKLGRF